MSDLKIVITGDAKSVQAAFLAVTSGAEKMSTTVELAGQEAGQGLARLEQTATQTAGTTKASFEGIGSAIGKAGLAFGAFSLIAGQAAGQSEASAARLSTAFQNAGLEISDYQGQITQLNNTGLHLAFDDEDVQDALARFVGQTKDVAKSIKDVQLAEDIARGTGKSLADATNLVVQAEAGRFRGLAQLGIALDGTATKEDYLAAAQAKYAGSADAYAKTGAATFDRYKNSAENALESIGGKLEGLQLTIIALSTAASTLGPLAGTLKGIADSEKAAELGGAAMDLALGPVGLAAAALAAGAGIVYLLNRTRDYTTAAEVAAGATQDLTNFFLSLEQATDPSRALALKGFLDQFTTFSDDAAKRETDFESIKTAMGSIGAAGINLSLAFDGTTSSVLGLTEAQLKYIDSTYGVGAAQGDGVVTYNELAAAAADYEKNLDRLNATQEKAQNADIPKIFSQSGVDYQKAIDGIEKWEGQLQAGLITGDQYIALLDNAANDHTVFAATIGTTTNAIGTNTEAVNTNGNAIAAQMAAYDAQNSSLNQAIRFNQANTGATKAATEATVSNGAAIAAQMAQYDAANQSLDQAIRFNLANTTAIQESTAATLLHQGATSGDADALASIGRAQLGVSVPAHALTDAVKQQAQALKDNEAAAQAAAQAIDDYRQKLGEVHMVVNDGANQFAKHATIAGDALDSGYRVAVGNTDAIAQQSAGVAKWADDLIGVKGTYAEIDKLLAKGTISQEEYNRAQSAETSILHNNAAIQRDVQKIQTDQAPLLATLTKRERDYLDALAKDTPQQQLVRLGYMDSAESAKALAAAQLAASAAAGELGKNGVETATKMIQAAAEADPVLESLLEDMHLISVDPVTGDITVNFDDVTNGKSAMDKLIDRIGDLVTALQDIFHIGVDSGDVTTGADETFRLNSELDKLNGKNVTYSVVGDYTTNVIRNYQNGTSSGDPSVGGDSSGGVGGGQTSGGGFTDPFGDSTGAGFANGGVIPAANGAVLVGEFGPELLRRNGGGAFVLPTGATKSRMAMGGFGGGDLHLHIHGNVYGMDDLTEQVTRQLVPAIVAATKRHYSGHGIRG